MGINEAPRVVSRGIRTYGCEYLAINPAKWNDICLLQVMSLQDPDWLARHEGFSKFLFPDMREYPTYYTFPWRWTGSLGYKEHPVDVDRNPIPGPYCCESEHFRCFFHKPETGAAPEEFVGESFFRWLRANGELDPLKEPFIAVDMQKETKFKKYSTVGENTSVNEAYCRFGSRHWPYAVELLTHGKLCQTMWPLLQEFFEGSAFVLVDVDSGSRLFG